MRDRRLDFSYKKLWFASPFCVVFCWFFFDIFLFKFCNFVGLNGPTRQTHSGTVEKATTYIPFQIQIQIEQRQPLFD